MSLENLPVQWSKEQLGNLSNFIDYRGKTPTKTAEGIPLITAKNIRDGYINRVPREYIAEDAYDEWMTRGIPLLGDLVITTEAPMGNVAVLNIQEKFALAQRAICLNFKYNKDISKFLYYYLRSQSFKTDLQDKATGTTVQGIKAAELKKIFVPLAPLAEQQEIVRQLDLMLAQVEQIQARLDAIPAILKKFRQSVLADAVSGKLTEEWRNSKGFKGDLDVELKQIKVNRESKVFGNQKRSLDFSVDENLKPVFELPPSWKLVGLGDLIEFLTDYHANGSYEKLRDHVTLLDKENYACMIRATNFEKNNFDDLLIYIDQTAYEFLTKTKLFGNEILISKIGNAGSVYLMPKLNRPCSLAMNLFMLRFDESIVNPRYINYFLTSIFGEKYINQYVRGVATKSIDKKSVRNVFIHYPCLNEQNQIVQVIDQLFEYADRIEATVQSAQKRVNLLTQSILAKAFSGELTAEWREQHQELITGVNSAESLLAKIQAEREASKPVKKARKA